MTKHYTNLLAAAALTVGTAFAANAITVSPGDDVIDSFAMNVDEAISFDFEPTENVVISVISVAGTGFSNGLDLSKVLFGVNGAASSFSVITDNGATASAEGILGSFSASTPFTLDFAAAGTDKRVGITYSFSVSANTAPPVAPIPLPATGLLLGSLLLAGGITSARRKRK